MKVDEYISKIIEETALTRKDIQEKMEKKKEELKGLISDEGALFLIAKELGVNIKSDNKEILQDIEIKVSDITLNMKNITLVGRVKNINNVNKFNKKDGGEGFVGSFVLHDNSGDIRIVLWDEINKILEDPNFDINALVKIINGYPKKGRFDEIEINIGRMGKVLVNPEDVDNKKYPKMKNESVKINEIKTSAGSVNIEGQIVQKFPIKEFIKKDGEKGRVGSIILKDNSGSIRITFWNDDVEKLDNLDVDMVISITNLTPKISTMDSKSIELTLTKSSQISKKAGKMRFEEEIAKNIQELQDKQNLVSFRGIVTSIDNIKKISLKSGEDVDLLKFTVSDDTDSINVAVWREKAKEIAESLQMGKGILLKNCVIKFNKFSNKKDITFTDNSVIELVELDIKNLKILDTNKLENKPTLTGFKEDVAKNIQELQDKQNIVSFQGVVTSIDNVKPIALKSGEEKDLLNFFVSDDTDSIRVAVWGEKAKEISETLQMGKGILLKSVMIKDNKFSNKKDITFTINSTIEFIELDIKDLKKAETPKIEKKTNFSGNYTKINDIKSEGFYEIKGFITKELKSITIYEACKNCSRKIDNCKCAPKGPVEPRMILNAIIDDESGTIRTTFVGDKAESLIGEKTDLISKIKETPDFEKFLEKKSSNLVGKDIILRGKAKYSDYSQSYELSVFDFKDININQELDKSMSELEP